MHVEYWICDYCHKEIEYEEKKKYTTPEMGIPFIPKGGGGKHYHFLCLLTHYRKKRNPKLTPEEIQDLMEDAERRHNTRVCRSLKKGDYNLDKLEKRRATKKDREDLINYFYNYYGIRVISKRLNALIDSLNDGKDFENIRNTKISYYQLRDMLIFYRNTLDKEYANQKKKNNNFVNPAQRLFYDIVIIINNLEDYSIRRAAVYNIENNVKIDGGGKLEDYSKYFQYNVARKHKHDQQKLDEMDEMVREIMGYDNDDTEDI